MRRRNRQRGDTAVASRATNAGEADPRTTTRRRRLAGRLGGVFAASSLFRAFRDPRPVTTTTIPANPSFSDPGPRIRDLVPESAPAANAGNNDDDNDGSDEREDEDEGREHWWRGMADLRNATHPHMGARVMRPIRHGIGEETVETVFQMIVDPSPERLAKPFRGNSYGYDVGPICPSNNEFGIEREKGHAALLEIRGRIRAYEPRVEQDGNGSDNDSGSDNGEELRRRSNSKILCMVCTVDTPTNRRNLKAQAETWAPGCDGFFAASNVTDHSLGAIDLVHQGPEAYGNTWQKIRSMWVYACDHYLGEYDFFHVAGDDVYIAVENLRRYLDEPDVLRLERGHLDALAREPPAGPTPLDVSAWIDAGKSRPLVLGTPCHSFKKGVGVWFPAGRPGYVLNRAALQLFEGYQAGSIDPREDLFVGSMFRDQGVLLSHTLDRDGGFRHGGSAQSVVRARWACVSKKLLKWKGIHFEDNTHSISKDTIAFHLKDDKDWLEQHGRTIPELMHRYHAILYALCPDEPSRAEPRPAR